MSMSILPVSQNKRRALLRNVMIGVGLALFGCVFAARIWDAEMQAPVLALLLVFCVLAVAQFEALDEMAKQAQYVAWYWGSMLGVLAFALIQILFAFTGEPFVAAQDWLVGLVGGDAKASFLAGMALTPLLMIAGFTIWWSVYWLRRR
jgi:hypothetical protein